MIPASVSASALAGRHVLVTRPAGQATGLCDALAAEGATATAIPTIRIEDPPDGSSLSKAARELSRYDWVLLTSANGVWRLARAAERESTLDDFRRARIGVIGPATAEEVARWGGTPSVIPETYQAEGLVDALLAGETGGVAGARVLLAGAREARSVLPEALAAAGARVDVVVAYSTVVERGGERALVDLLDRKALDWVTFTASSAVKAYVDLVGTRTAGARVAVIGPITAATAEELGLSVAVQAVRHTTAGLVEALIEDACRAGGS